MGVTVGYVVTLEMESPADARGSGELRNGALGFFGGWGPGPGVGSRGLEAAGRGGQLV